MEKCSVTTLDVNSNNTSLMKIGELRLTITASAAYTFNVKALNNVMNIESGSRDSILADGSSVSLPWLFSKGTGADGTVDFSVDSNYQNNDIRFVEMSNLKMITVSHNKITSVLIEGLKQIESANVNLNEFTVANAKVKEPEGIHVEWFKNLEHIGKIALVNAKVCGNIADVPLSCKTFNVSATSNPDLVGNIVDVFGERRSVEYIAVRGSNCTGDIADLADAQANLSGSVHRTTGSIRVLCGLTPITNSAPGATKTDGYIYFTSDTTTYPRGWYWTE